MELMDKSETKRFLRRIGDLYGTKKLKFGYVFFKSNKNKVYICTKESVIGDDLNPKARGLYFAKFEPVGVRLSLDGAQIIGPLATKNVYSIENLEEYMSGKNIECSEKLSNFVIVKCKNDFLGAGLYQKGKIINFVPKERRMKVTLSV